MIDKKYIIVSDIIIKRENEILLCLHKNKNEYELPGAHVYETFNLTNTIARFAKEQVNLIINANDIKLIHVMEYSEKNKMFFTFITEKYKGDISITNCNEYTHYCWFPFNELPNNINDKLLFTFNNIKNNKLYSDYKKEC